MTADSVEDLLDLPPANAYSTDPADAEDPALRRIKADLSEVGEVVAVNGLVSTTQTHGVILGDVEATVRNDAFVRDIRIDVSLDEAGGMQYANHGVAAAISLPSANAYEGSTPSRFRSISDKAFQHWNDHPGVAAARQPRGKLPASDPFTAWKVLRFFVDLAVVLLGMQIMGYAIREYFKMMGEILTLDERMTDLCSLVLIGVSAILGTAYVFVRFLGLLVSATEHFCGDDDRPSSAEFDERFLEREKARKEFDADLSKTFQGAFANAGDLSVFLEGLMSLGDAYGLHEMRSFSITGTDRLVDKKGDRSTDNRRVFTRPCVIFAARKESRKDASSCYVFDGEHIFRHDTSPLSPAGPVQIP